MGAKNLSTEIGMCKFELFDNFCLENQKFHKILEKSSYQVWMCHHFDFNLFDRAPVFFQIKSK